MSGGICPFPGRNRNSHTWGVCFGLARAYPNSALPSFCTSNVRPRASGVGSNLQVGGTIEIDILIDIPCKQVVIFKLLYFNLLELFNVILSAVFV